jgi:hypothetical protein
MKTLALAALSLLALSASPSAQQAASTADLRAVVRSYLEIQTHLAADRFAEVRAPASTLAAQAAALGKNGEAIAKAAAALQSAADLAAAREAFGPLSDAVIARVQADGSPEALSDLRLGYCPMAKRSWLQREEQVRNPYYGKGMLTCGELKPVKK